MTSYKRKTYGPLSANPDPLVDARGHRAHLLDGVSAGARYSVGDRPTTATLLGRPVEVGVPRRAGRGRAAGIVAATSAATTDRNTTKTLGGARDGHGESSGVGAGARAIRSPGRGDSQAPAVGGGDRAAPVRAQSGKVGQIEGLGSVAALARLVLEMGVEIGGAKARTATLLLFVRGGGAIVAIVLDKVSMSEYRKYHG